MIILFLRTYWPVIFLVVYLSLMAYFGQKNVDAINTSHEHHNHIMKKDGTFIELNHTISE